MPHPILRLKDTSGQWRHLGNIIPAKRKLSSQWPVFGSVATAPMVPRSEWKKLVDQMGTDARSPFLSPPHDQNGQGMCNASATCSAIESQRLKQGLPLKLLSGGDLYWRINGGVDQGSFLEDGLKESMEVGVAVIEVAPYLTKSRANPGAVESRKSYRVLEAFLCPTFDHAFSATLQSFDLISGIMWYQNYVPGRDGWLPKAKSGRAGGHAVHGYKPTYRGDEYGIWHKNSWGEKWGLNGCCVFPETAYAGPVGGWWAVRSVVDEGGDAPSPIQSKEE